MHVILIPGKQWTIPLVTLEGANYVSGAYGNNRASMPAWSDASRSRRFPRACVALATRHVHGDMMIAVAAHDATLSCTT